MVSIHVPEDALCHQSVRRSPDHRNLWESHHFRESTETMRARHEIARAYCAQCPLLNSCEEMLSACEAEGTFIDGVVAGRYTVLQSHGHHQPRQEKCKVCGVKLWPPNTRRQRLFPGEAKHAGEGLCEQCFPMASRRGNGMPTREMIA